MTPDGLNLRQTLFVEAYLGDARGNGVQAARMAGYSGTPNVLHVTAARLLRNATVLARIRERVAAITDDTTAILQALWEVASAPTAHHMVVTREEQFDADGNRVKEMQVRQDYSAKVRALELLMKYHGMLTNKPPTEVRVKALVGVDISRI
jgi:phage terminase small subunit